MFLYVCRYGFLLSEANVSQDPLSISVAVLQQFNIPPEMYQVGYTKLYLRTGQVHPSILLCASVGPEDILSFFFFLSFLIIFSLNHVDRCNNLLTL